MLLNLSYNHVPERKANLQTIKLVTFNLIIQTNKAGHFQPRNTKSIYVIGQPRGWHAIPGRKVFFSNTMDYESAYPSR